MIRAPVFEMRLHSGYVPPSQRLYMSDLPVFRSVNLRLNSSPREHFVQQSPHYLGAPYLGGLDVRPGISHEHRRRSATFFWVTPPDWEGIELYAWGATCYDVDVCTSGSAWLCS